jgi:hypothetical protein
MHDGLRSSTLPSRTVQKASAIGAALAGTDPNVAYAETSHMFVKTFADVVLKTLAKDAGRITVIILKRDVRAVVLSQLKLGWFANGHSGYDVWYYNPETVHPSERQNVMRESSCFSHTSDPMHLSALDAAISYVADIAARSLALEAHIAAEHAQGRLLNVLVARAQLEQLVGGGAEGIAFFLGEIGLRPDHGKIAVLGMQDRNARESKKNHVESEVSYKDVAARVAAISETMLPGLVE